MLPNPSLEWLIRSLLNILLSLLICEVTAVAIISTWLVTDQKTTSVYNHMTAGIANTGSLENKHAKDVKKAKNFCSVTALHAVLSSHLIGQNYL